MGLKVAIVGLSSSTRHLIPATGWELWGLAWDAELRYTLDRTFEMHQRAHTERSHDDVPKYLESIRHCRRLYVADAYPEVPDAELYPLEAVISTCGDYFASSVAYMLALAIHEGAEEIALYGVDMRSDSEYAGQKPNAEYLIGLARGKGIKVHIPDQSPLCKYEPQDGFTSRYGWMQ